MVMATPFTDVVEGGVAWREAGDRTAAAAVFLHGLGGRRTNWDPQLEALSDLGRCCAVDLPRGTATPPEPVLDVLLPDGTHLPLMYHLGLTMVNSGLFADRPDPEGHA